MPWYIVVIEKSDVADMSAKGLLDKFEHALRDVFAEAENPKEVAIFHGYDVFENHVYCFSPAAASIAIGNGVFGGFSASACSEKPNLDGFREVKDLVGLCGDLIRALVKTKEGWTSETEVHG